MKDISVPKILEYYKTETLDKGRVRTSLYMFMIDGEVFDSLCLNYIRQEASVVECRVGSVVKHPKDKYDKVIAKQEAVKRLAKQKFSIHTVFSKGYRTVITLDNGMQLIKINDKIMVKL